MTEKVTGYSLIGLGMVIIFLSLILAWSVFSGKSQAPQIFNFEGIGFDLTQFGDLPADATHQTLQAGNKAEIISPDVLNKPLNLTAYLLFMTFSPH